MNFEGFSLHVEQPYLIITRTSQTLSSRFSNFLDLFSWDWNDLVPMEISQKAYEIVTKSYERDLSRISVMERIFF